MGKFIDLTGKRFGKLLVIKREENSYSKSGNPKVMWRCKCDCGNEKNICSAHLLKGNTRSCGCLGGVLRDLTGRKFGLLTVNRRVGADKNGLALWECTCDCGNKCTMSYIKIVYNKKPSCGCADFQNSMIGRKFGKLTVIKREGADNSQKATWLCQCECGNSTIVTGDRLRSGMTKSCGCLRIYNFPTQNGLSRERLYKTWNGMKSRCYNEKDSSFSNYGAKGIKVCDEWTGENGYLNFYEWSIKHGYDDSLTIDRIDSNGDYAPNNCRWSTMVEQANNRCTNLRFEINGEIDTLANWCRRY